MTGPDARPSRASPAAVPRERSRAARRADLLVIPLLLVLGLAAAVEWRVHRALFVARHGDPDVFVWPPDDGAAARRAPSPRHGGPVRVHAFLAGAVGVLLAILLLAVAGIGGLFLAE